MVRPSVGRLSVRVEAEHKGCSHARLRRRMGAHRALAWRASGVHWLPLVEDRAPSLPFVSCTHKCSGQGGTATFLLRFQIAFEFPIHSPSGSWRAMRGGRDMKVGFIGVGAMGRPMAANLIKKGFTVTAYDASVEALAAIVNLGAAQAGSSADAARVSDVVITILPSSANVVAAYLGEGRVLEGAAAGRLCVDMSTI